MLHDKLWACILWNPRLLEYMLADFKYLRDFLMEGGFALFPKVSIYIFSVFVLSVSGTMSVNVCQQGNYGTRESTWELVEDPTDSAL